MQFVCEALRSWKNLESVRVRRTAARPVRLTKSKGKLEQGLDSQRSLEHVAICASAAGFEAVGDYVARRRNDASDQYQALGRAARSAGFVGQGRRRESDRIVQG